jgi:outer membrane protein assembly factor BamB
LSNQSQILCLSRRDGRIRWIMQLEVFEDPESRTNAIHWIGPLVIAGQILAIGNHGQVVAISPANGEEIARFKIPKSAVTAIVSDKTLYVLSENADLRAYR